VLTFMLAAVLQVQDPLAVVDDRIRSDHDMLRYHIAISLPDTGQVFWGATEMHYLIRSASGQLVLDFDSVFVIDSIATSNGRRLSANVQRGELVLPHWGAVGDTLSVTIYYHGAPRDGLFIQDNVHGERTAFADNWPNRARHWFPGEDHPSDKAYASFAVDVPAGWRAVANGRLERVDTLSAGRSRWHWETTRPIPVYTMVIGAGPLTVTEIRGVSDVPQALWTFRQDSAFAVDGPFRRVDQMVDVYSRLIGPFPYAKLAHVESSTRFGGMENSSAIFYTERGYANRTMGEGLVAHETAHQWFGDAVTEHDWHHLWLSEGFASYFDPLFFQLIGEEDRFRQGMRESKQSYMGSAVVDRPVIDTTVTDLFALLNANNYPKGAWILHMLRGEVGDSAFFRGIREYYHTYRDSTALTDDLMAIMERHADRPLRRFFEQWLLQPGYPQLEMTWSYDTEGHAVTITARQAQPASWGTFDLTVPVMVQVGGDFHTAALRFARGERSAEVTVSGVESPPTNVVLDSDETLLIRVTAPAGGA